MLGCLTAIRFQACRRTRRKCVAIRAFRSSPRPTCSQQPTNALRSFCITERQTHDLSHLLSEVERRRRLRLRRSNSGSNRLRSRLNIPSSRLLRVAFASLPSVFLLRSIDFVGLVQALVQAKCGSLGNALFRSVFAILSPGLGPGGRRFESCHSDFFLK